MSTSAKKTPADAKKPSTGAKAKTGKERPVLAGEDDEFEDFPAETWTSKDEDKEDEKLWEDNWDDDDVDENFTAVLRKEIAKVTGAQK